MSRTPTQLPPGRHGLSRAEVRSSQLNRMLAAMAAAVAERGYASTSVADVIRRAGVSRETFYEQFADKEGCFLAAFDAAVRELTERMLGALAEGNGRTRARPDEPLERLDRALAVYLDVLAREPALARTFLIEVYAAGPVALRRRVAAFDGFVDLLVEGLGSGGPRERFACEALVGATSSMVTGRVALGRYEELPALREPLIEIARRLLADGSKR